MDALPRTLFYLDDDLMRGEVDMNTEFW